MLGTVGAFTPGCSVRHLPGFIDHLSEIKSKGVDLVAVIAFNDAWVMSAWAKANSIKDEIVGSHSASRLLILTLSQLFMTDTDARFSKDIGWTKGDRTGRYAMIIDHGKIMYAQNEPGGDVTVGYSCLPHHAIADWFQGFRGRRSTQCSLSARCSALVNFHSLKHS